MDFEKLFGDWYPEYYDSRETQTYDYELFLELLGTPKRVLEICCGTGRILLPLARAGHEMHGIDISRHMLARLMKKAQEAHNIHITLDDVLTADWGTGFEAVLLAGNIIINIEGSANYKADQQKLIRKAFGALKPGGHLIMDNDGHPRPEEFFRTTDIPITREIPADSKGITACIDYLWSKYDIESQIASGCNRFELETPEGEVFFGEENWLKHIPLIPQMTEWVKAAGFEIINLWGDHYKNPITEHTHRLVCWARKPG